MISPVGNLIEIDSSNILMSLIGDIKAAIRYSLILFDQWLRLMRTKDLISHKLKVRCHLIAILKTSFSNILMEYLRIKRL